MADYYVQNTPCTAGYIRLWIESSRSASILLEHHRTAATTELFLAMLMLLPCINLLSSSSIHYPIHCFHIELFKSQQIQLYSDSDLLIFLRLRCHSSWATYRYLMIPYMWYCNLKQRKVIMTRVIYITAYGSALSPYHDHPNFQWRWV